MWNSSHRFGQHAFSTLTGVQMKNAQSFAYNDVLESRANLLFTGAGYIAMIVMEKHKAESE